MLSSGQHLRTQYIAPPVGLRKSDMFKEGWALPNTRSVGCNYLLPVPSNSSEISAMQNGLMVVGSPGGLQLGQIPNVSYNVSLYAWFFFPVEACACFVFLQVQSGACFVFVAAIRIESCASGTA